MKTLQNIASFAKKDKIEYQKDWPIMTFLIMKVDEDFLETKVIEVGNTVTLTQKWIDKNIEFLKIRD